MPQIYDKGTTALLPSERRRAESTRFEGMIRKQCKTCLKSLQSTPSFDWLAQPTKTTEPTKQCVVLTGTPILVASRNVNAAPSSIVNPLEVKQVNYISHAWNISTNRVGN